MKARRTIAGWCASVFAMSALAVGITGCALSRPLPSAYDRPPYSNLVVGTAAVLTNPVPAVLPAISAGQFAGFFVCVGGGTNRVSCPEPLSLAVQCAAGAASLEAGVTSSVIRRASSGTELEAAVAHGRLERVRERLTLSSATESASVVSPSETVELGARDDRTRVAPVDAVQEALPIARVDAQAPAAVSTRSVEQSVAAGATPLVGIEGQAAVGTVGAQATLGGVDDRQLVKLLADMNIVQVLMDQNLVDGFYDAVNLLMAPSEQVPPEEQALFAQALLKGGSLSQFLDRPCSAGFRAQAAGAGAGECAGEAKWVALGKGPFHHGGRVILVLEVKNRGTRPVYDLLLLAGIPERARFALFPVQNPGQRGFLNAHLSDRSLLVWKLYRPLQPGQTFRASVVLTLEPWIVGARTIVRKSL